MNLRFTGILVSLTAAAVFMFTGCAKKQSEQAKQDQPSLGPGSGSSVAGIRWSIPERWKVLSPRTMRIATYLIQAAENDSEAAECAVFYFGSREGGNVEMNINRWISQFENPGKPEQSQKEINGLHLTIVRIKGTYLAPTGPRMESQGKKENYRLIGAIIAAPEGSVFFKLTGPEKTVSAAEDEFNNLLGSISKQQPA